MQFYGIPGSLYIHEDGCKAIKREMESDQHMQFSITGYIIDHFTPCMHANVIRNKHIHSSDQINQIEQFRVYWLPAIQLHYGKGTILRLPGYILNWMF